MPEEVKCDGPAHVSGAADDGEGLPVVHSGGPGPGARGDRGFRDGVVSHVKRPVPCDPVEWLRTFGKVYLDGVDDQEEFLEAYRAACARHLPDGEIDYVRLRWRAVRCDDRSRSTHRQ